MADISLQKALRFVNVGEDPPAPPLGADWVGRRQWPACVEYGFISAGQGLRYNQPLLHLDIGDALAAFITGRGYVGVGTKLIFFFFFFFFFFFYFFFFFFFFFFFYFFFGGVPLFFLKKFLKNQKKKFFIFFFFLLGGNFL